MLKSIHTLLFYSKFLQLAGRKRNGSSAIGTNAASVCLSVCLSVFRISQKRADRFPWNFSWFKGVIRRCERKTSGKFRPLMCKNWENGAKWPISRKSPRVTRAGLCNGLRSEFARTSARWPKVRLWHGPIARWSGGMASGVHAKALCLYWTIKLHEARCQCTRSSNRLPLFCRRRFSNVN